MGSHVTRSGHRRAPRSAISMNQSAPPTAIATPSPFRGHAAAIVLFGTIAALYFTRDILVPFAFALTLTFLLSPAVALLQKLHMGRVASVLLTVLASMAIAGGIGWVIANQLVDVANQLPFYRQNIHDKVQAFHIP